MRPTDFLKEARAMGFAASKTGRGHIRLTRENPSAVVFVSSSPSDQRALRNVVADLRRASDPTHPFGKKRAHAPD